MALSWHAEPVALPPALAHEIASFEIGRHSNGKLARLHEWRIKEGVLHLTLQPSDYRTLLYSNRHVGRIVDIWGVRYLSRALGISAVVRARDQRILLIKRSADVGEYPLCHDVIGGHIDVPENGAPPDPIAAMNRELDEELALKTDQVSLSLLGLIENMENRKPELVFTADVNHTLEEVILGAENAVDRGEYLWPIVVADLQNYLRESYDRLSPSALGSLVLFNRLNS